MDDDLSAFFLDLEACFMAHLHGHSHDHDPAHHHGQSSGHPPQRLRWSMLRMTLMQRLGVVLAVSSALWAVVLLSVK